RSDARWTRGQKTVGMNSEEGSWLVNLPRRESARRQEHAKAKKRWMVRVPCHKEGTTAGTRHRDDVASPGLEHVHHVTGDHPGRPTTAIFLMTCMDSSPCVGCSEEPVRPHDSQRLCGRRLGHPVLQAVLERSELGQCREWVVDPVLER